jgi:hypothetical protein
MKQRNPTWGCSRTAQQIALAFGIPLNKDVVRRILAVSAWGVHSVRSRVLAGHDWEFATDRRRVRAGRLIVKRSRATARCPLTISIKDRQTTSMVNMSYPIA